MGAILRILNISRDEIPLVLTMTGLFFCLIFGGLLAVEAANSLISVNYGGTAHLPYLYILLAIITSFIAVFMTTFADRLPRVQLMQLTNSLILLFAMALFYTYNGGQPTVPFYYPGLFLGVQIAWLICNMQYWLIANDICDTREAKRLFSLFSIGGIVAGFFSGVAARQIVTYFDTINLLMVWAGTLLLAIILLAFLQEKFAHRLKIKHSGRGVEGFFQTIAGGMSYLWNEPMLKTMAVSLCLLQVLIFTTDYNFIEVMTRTQRSTGELATIFGWVRALASFASLFIQLFLTSRLISLLGVGNSFLVFPLSITIAFVNLGSSFNETSAMIARGNRIALGTSLFTAAQNMLYNPISPDVRGRVRTLISVFFEPLGIGLSGIVLLTMTTRFSPENICYLAAGLGFVVISLSLLIKKFYLQTLMQNLDSGTNEMRFEAIEFLGQEREMLQPLALALKSPKAHIRLNAAIALGQNKNPRSLPLLMEALNDRDDDVRDAVCDAIGKQGLPEIMKPLLNRLAVENVKKVKATIIKSLSRLGNDEVRNILLENLNDTDFRVIANSIEALQNFREDRNVLNTVKPFLGHDNHRVRASTAVLLILSGVREFQQRGMDTLTKMLYNRNKLMRCSALIAFGEINREEYLAFLVNALGDEDENVRYNAVKAIGKLASPRAIRDLLLMFSDPSELVRKETLNTLAQLGDRVVPLLIEIIEGEVNDRRKIVAIQALGQFGKKESIEPLLKLANSESNDTAQAAIEALVGINDPIVIEPLIAHLGTQNSKVKAAIISVLAEFKEKRLAPHFLALLADPADRIRANALDALEKLQDPAIANQVFPLLDDTSPRVKATAARLLERLGYPQGRERLLEMGRHPDKWQRISAFYAMGELGSSEFTMLMVEHLSDPDPDIKRNARLALEKIGSRMVLSGSQSQVEEGALRTISQYSLDPLIEATRNRDPKVRHHALKILLDIPDIPDLDPLIALLQSEDRDTLIGALKILAKYPRLENIDPILRCFNLGDEEARLFAIRALRGYPPEKIRDPLLAYSEKLSEKSRTIQNHLRKIQATHERVVIEKVGQGLTRELDGLVKTGLEILATLHEPKTILVIENKLKDPDPRVRANAIEALDSIGEKSIVRILLPILEAKLDLSGGPKEVGIFSIFTELLAEPHSTLKERTIEAIEELGFQKMVLPFLSLDPHNVTLMQKRSQFFRKLEMVVEVEKKMGEWSPQERQCFYALMEAIKGEKANFIQEMRGLLGSLENPGMVSGVLRVMSLIGGDKMIDLLAEYLVNPNPILQKEALDGLLSIDSDVARNLVLEYYQRNPDFQTPKKGTDKTLDHAANGEHQTGE